MTSFTCDAILFDMDNTLLDSSAVVLRQWRLWATRHGLDPEHVVSVCHGRRALETMRLVAPHLATEAEAAAFLQAEEDDPNPIIAIPGAATLLGQLPADRWAVVTSATRRLALARFDRAGLPRPLTLVPADEIERGKPHPEGYLKAATLLGADARCCLVVEDAPAGIAAGKAAGAQVLGMLTTVTQAELGDVPAVQDFTGMTIETGPPLRLHLPSLVAAGV